MSHKVCGRAISGPQARWLKAVDGGFGRYLKKSEPLDQVFETFSAGGGW
jgi:hypothetical protein